MQIPIPSDPMTGMVEITATFCFATPTDPQDPLNYTRSGLEVRFRPHDQKRKDPNSCTRTPASFFRRRMCRSRRPTCGPTRTSGKRTLHKTRSMRASGLRNPVFDVHYNARIGGRNAHSADKIPYALVITISVEEDAQPLRQDPAALPDDSGAAEARRRNSDPHLNIDRTNAMSRIAKTRP